MHFVEENAEGGIWIGSIHRLGQLSEEPFGVGIDRHSKLVESFVEEVLRREPVRKHPLGEHAQQGRLPASANPCKDFDVRGVDASVEPFGIEGAWYQVIMHCVNAFL